jgi:hypothetical protein
MVPSSVPSSAFAQIAFSAGSFAVGHHDGAATAVAADSTTANEAARPAINGRFIENLASSLGRATTAVA